MFPNVVMGAVPPVAGLPMANSPLADITRELALHKKEICELRAMVLELKGERKEAGELVRKLDVRFNEKFEPGVQLLDDQAHNVGSKTCQMFDQLEQDLATLTLKLAESCELQSDRMDEISAQINQLQQGKGMYLQEPVRVRPPSLGKKKEPQVNGKLQSIQEIQACGNISVDGSRIQVLRDIQFVPRRATDPPTAELADPEEARPIFDHIAAACKYLGEKVIVEGHTKGGGTQFWQDLADARARLVGQELVARGVNPKYMTTRGLPKHRGSSWSLNKVSCVIHVMPIDDSMGSPISPRSVPCM